MMGSSGKKMFAGLDRALTRMTGRPVRTGFTAPYVIIVANLILMLVALAGILQTTQGQAFGHDLIVIALNGTIFYSVAVEYIERGNRTPDERQSAIRWKSLAIAGWIVISLVMIWAVLLGQFAKNGLWYPTHVKQWPSLGLFIGALALQIGAIASAWMTPSYAAALDDED